MKRWLIACALLVLAGLNAGATAQQIPPAPGPDQALVYIYRVPNIALSGRGTTFRIDDKVVARMWQKHFTWVLAPAGDHVLTQKWPIDITLFQKTQIEGHWEGGRTYYYRLTTSVDSGPGTGLTFRWLLAEVPARTALKDIASYKYQAALNGEKPQAQTAASKMGAPAADPD